MDVLTQAVREKVGELLGITRSEEEILAILAVNAFLRLPQTIAITGLSSAYLYRLMQEGSFPRPVVLGPNARAWRLSEIKVWMQSRVAARDTGADVELRAVNPNIGKGRPRKQRAA